MRKNPNTNLNVLLGEENLKVIEHEQDIGLDLETSGLSPWRDKIAVISILAPKSKTHLIIHCRGKISKRVKQWLGTRERLTLHNGAGFDLLLMHEAGIDVFKPTVHDTMLAELALLTTDRRDVSVSLKSTMYRRTGKKISKDADHSGWMNPRLTENQVNYCVDDIKELINLRDAQLTRADDEQLNAIGVENDLIPVLVKMVCNGMPIDLAKLKAFLKGQERDIVETTRRLSEKLGPINFASHVQLKKALVMANPAWELKSTGAEVLEEIIMYPGALSDICTDLLTLRHAAQRKKMYRPEWIQKYVVDGVVHPRIWSCSTDTGRMSSSDPNCFSDDTEVMTRQGWKLFSGVTEQDELAQFDQVTDKITFSCPDEIILRQYKGPMVQIRNLTNTVNLLVTPDHDCLIRGIDGSYVKVHAEHYPTDMTWGSKWYQPHSGLYDGAGQKLSLPEIILLAAIQADGSVDKYRIMWGLTKKRKIKRLTWAMNELGLVVTKYPDTPEGQKRFAIKFSENELPEWIQAAKFFGSWLLDFDAGTLKLLFEELRNWDGRWKGETLQYFSSISTNCDWAQILGILSGVRCTVRKYDSTSQFPGDHPQMNMCCGSYKRKYTGTKSCAKQLLDYEGMVYCVTMPKGTVIVRREGAAVITGQCQQIPADMRSIYGGTPGHKVVWADLSQAEIRVAAAVANCPGLRRVFSQGLHVHTDIASKSFRVDYDKVDDNLKKLAKGLTFTMLFGGAWETFQLHARQAGTDLSDQECQKIFKDFFNAYPGMRDLKKTATRMCYNHRNSGRPLELRLPTGLKRLLVGWKIKPSVLMNTLIQGGAAAGMKFALLEAHRRGLTDYLSLTVHDELVAAWVPNKMAEEYGHELVEVLNFGLSQVMADVPSEAVYKVGDYWGK